MNTTTTTETQTAVDRHNAYGFVKPGADACYICGRKAFNTPVEGFSVRDCDRCERPVGECCAEVDCGGEDEGHQWICDSLRGGCAPGRPRDFVQEFQQAADEICNRLADQLDEVDQRLGLRHDHSALRTISAPTGVQ